MSCCGPNTKGNQSLNQVVTVIGSTGIYCPVVDCDVLNADTINARVENITNVDSQDVLGYVRATEDVWANSTGGTGPGATGVSLIETAARTVTNSASISSLSAGVTGLANSVSSLSASVTGMQGQIDTLSAGQTGLQAEIVVLQNQYVGLTGAIADKMSRSGDSATGTYSFNDTSGNFRFKIQPQDTDNLLIIDSAQSGSTSGMVRHNNVGDRYFDQNYVEQLKIDPNKAIQIDSNQTIRCRDMITFGNDTFPFTIGPTGAQVGSQTGAYCSATGDFYARSFVQYGTDAQINSSGIFSGVDVQTPSCPSLNAFVNSAVGGTGYIRKNFSDYGSYPLLTPSGTGYTGGMMAILNPLQNNCYYVSTAGSDINDGLSLETPFASLSAALTAVGNSGRNIIVCPGVYSGNVSFSNTNITISSLNTETSGNVSFSGTWTFNHSTSSIRVNGISINSVIVTGSGNLYMQNCKTVSFSVSSAAFVELVNCDTQSSTLTGTVAANGSGQMNINGGYSGILTIGSSGRAVSITNVTSSLPIIVSSGVLGVRNSVVFSGNSSTAAVTLSSGATMIAAQTNFLDPSFNPARLTIPSGSFYSFSNCIYDVGNTTLSGTRVTRNDISDALIANSALIYGDLIVRGNITFGNTGSISQYQTNIFESVDIQFNGGPSGTTPALSISQTGGVGPIMRVTDADSNQKFNINQNCDLNINDKFFVQNSSGNTNIVGELQVTGASQFSSASLSGNLNLRVAATGGSGVTGSIFYNSTVSQPQVYNGSTWSTIGGGTTIVTTNLAVGDSAYYDGTNYVNGYFCRVPTLSANFKTLTVGAFATPYSFSQTGCQYLIYSDPAGTSLVSDSGFLAGNPSYTYGSLTLGTTYYAKARQYGNWTNAMSPYTNLLSFTPTDAIAGQLTTSLAAYNAAATDTLVQITLTEYNNINTNLSLSALYNQASTAAATSITTKAICPYGSSNTITNPAYFVTFAMRASGSSSSGTNSMVSMSSNQNNLTSTQVWMNLDIPSGLTNGTIYYFCWKQPANLVGNSGSNVFQCVFNSAAPCNANTTNPVASNYYNTLGGGSYSPGSNLSLNNGPAIYDYPLCSVHVTATKQW